MFNYLVLLSFSVPGNEYININTIDTHYRVVDVQVRIVMIILVVLVRRKRYLS